MAQNAPPYGQVELIEDVKRTVLDYISLYADLRALCLVSRAWNNVATRYLYTHIVFDIRFRNGPLGTFQRCLQYGAKRHLQYTRSFGLLDVSNPRISSASQDGRVVKNAAPWREPHERNQLLLEVLQLLPNDQLRTFRYISEVSLSPVLLDYINKHQKSIENFYVTRCQLQRLITSSKRNVIASFQHYDDKKSGFIEFSQALPPLTSLSLLFWDGWTVDVSEYWTNKDILDLSYHRKVATSELVVTGCMPQTFTSAMSYIIDLSIVTRLSLLDCNMWLFHDISNSTSLQNLTHFQLTTRNMISPFDSKDIQALFERNHNLQHVHLNLCGLGSICIPSPTPFEIVPPVVPSDFNTFDFWSLRQGLKTLSLYDPTWAQLRGPALGGSDMPCPNVEISLGFPSESSMKYICHKFGGLQQLGVKASEQFLADAFDVNKRSEVILQGLEPLSLLKDLRILYLYQDRMRMVHPLHFRTEDTLALDIHEFATLFFEWAHIYCPQLNVLIWGMYGGASEEEFQGALERADEWDLVVEQSSQHLFVKRVERLNNGMIQVTAVPTTRSRVQDDFPELDLLAYDPGYQILERFGHQL